MAVHVLKHGFTLCGEGGVPWDEMSKRDPDHKWVSFRDQVQIQEITCQGCAVGYWHLLHPVLWKPS